MASKTVLWSSTLGDVSVPVSATNVGTGVEAGSLQTLQLDLGTKTATAVAGAATLNKNSGVITSEALSTAAAASYVLTLTNSTVVATDQVLASVQYGSATTGAPCITTVSVSADQIVFTVQNVAASAALNGTIKITFVTLIA
jgi:hypothetical protein